MRKLLAFTTIAAAALASSSPASAATVLFDITGSAAMSFTLDQSPTPDFVTSDYFRLTAQPFTLGNGFATQGDIDFGTDGLLIVGDYIFRTSSLTPLFSGSTSNPTFLFGNYDLFGHHRDVRGDEALFTHRLSISDVSAVPEPATWAMMLIGFGAIGFALRGRKEAELTIRRAA